MKKIIYTVAIVALAANALTSCSNDDDVKKENKIVIENDTISFEGAKWNALIDTNEYYGDLLYTSEEKKAYTWQDDSTKLSGGVNKGQNWATHADEWMFWNGGTAVSNYKHSIENCDYNNQLSIDNETRAKSGTNFLVAYSTTSMKFSDNNARTIKGLWVNNTAYTINSLQNGIGTAAASDTTKFIVKFTAIDKNGKSIETKYVEAILQNGKTSVKSWTYVNLEGLGDVYGISLSFAATQDQYTFYGLSTPTYVAIDDIIVKKLVPVTVTVN